MNERLSAVFLELVWPVRPVYLRRRISYNLSFGESGSLLHHIVTQAAIFMNTKQWPCGISPFARFSELMVYRFIDDYSPFLGGRVSFGF